MQSEHFARRGSLFVIRFVLPTLGLVSSIGAGGNDKDLKQFLEGVQKIGICGSPGVLAVFGENAFPVVVGKIDDDVKAPVVAAGTLGSGRVTAFTHNGYFSQGALGEGDGARFFDNAVRWTAQKPKDKVHVAVVGSDEFAKYLASRGFDAQKLDSVAKVDKPSHVDVVLVAGGASLSPADASVLVNYVKHGGGLMTADTPWGWAQLNPGKTLFADHALNRILWQAGLAYSGAIVGETTDHGFVVDAKNLELTHALRALEALEAKEPAAAWTPQRTAQAGWSVTNALRSLPEDDKVFRPRLAKLLAAREIPVPTARSPLKADQRLERLLLSIELEEILASPASKVRAHAAATDFPGSVPPDAPRVVRTVQIDTRVPEWRSTGLYAAPGETIEVQIPAAWTGKGLSIQIGAHTDELFHLDAWPRCPKIVRRDALVAEQSRFASPFGGSIYVVVPERTIADTVPVRIRNAVEAPRFVLGETDAAQWRDRIRNAPAPWAELETKKIVITVQSSAVRKLDDPSALMQFWDRVLDADADLAGIPHDRPYPQRYVADVEISAGYMHSGYPIMTHLDVAEVITNLDKLATDADGCGWGFYHEMGHNHQDVAWTFEGTGEVTNNIFTVYVLDIVVGKEDARASQAECRKRWAEYARKGAKFDEWKADPFLALGMFLELKWAFGWDPFKKFFADYRGVPAKDRPQSDEEKREQWLIRFSHIVGRNLGPYFKAWGVPVRAEALAAVEDLPAWMPEGFTIPVKAAK